LGFVECSEASLLVVRDEGRCPSIVRRGNRQQAKAMDALHTPKSRFSVHLEKREPPTGEGYRRSTIPKVSVLGSLKELNLLYSAYAGHPSSIYFNCQAANSWIGDAASESRMKMLF